jgi:opacity protein-like surface antigen
MSNALPGLPARLALASALSLALLASPANAADARMLLAGASASAKTTTGGGAVAGTPISKLTARGVRAKVTRAGLAIPPAGAPAKIQAVIRAGNRIAKKPYKWGGGHARLNDSGYDCSGSISYALRKARLMTASLASTGFMSWGRRGPGKWITVRANAGHAYMVVAGLRFDTSSSKRTGSRWSSRMRSPRGYVATHPPGF